MHRLQSVWQRTLHATTSSAQSVSWYAQSTEPRECRFSWRHKEGLAKRETSACSSLNRRYLSKKKWGFNENCVSLNVVDRSTFQVIHPDSSGNQVRSNMLFPPFFSSMVCSLFHSWRTCVCSILLPVTRARCFPEGDDFISKWFPRSSWSRRRGDRAFINDSSPSFISIFTHRKSPWFFSRRKKISWSDSHPWCVGAWRSILMTGLASAASDFGLDVWILMSK